MRIHRSCIDLKCESSEKWSDWFFIGFRILWPRPLNENLTAATVCVHSNGVQQQQQTKHTKTQHRYAQCHNTTIHFYLIVKKREMHARTNHANNLPLALAVTLQSNRIRITVQLANGEKNILHSNEMHRLHQRHRCPFIDPCVRSSITVRSTVSSRKQ